MPEPIKIYHPEYDDESETVSAADFPKYQALGWVQGAPGADVSSGASPTYRNSEGESQDWMREEMTEPGPLPEAPQTTQREAAAAHLVQGGTAGLAPHIKAFTDTAMNTAKTYVTGGQGEAPAVGIERGTQAEPPGYGEFLKRARTPYKQTEKDWPKTAAVADLAGGLAVPLPGPGKFSAPAKGAKAALKHLATRQGVKQAGKMVAPGMAAGAIEMGARAEQDRITASLQGAGIGAAAGPILKFITSRPLLRAAAFGAGGAYAAETATDIIPGDQGEGWTVAAGVLGALTGANPKWAVKQWAKIRGAGEDIDTRRALEQLMDQTEYGKGMRAEIRGGNKELKRLLDDSASRMSEQEGLIDEVMTYAHTGLKPEAVEQWMVDDFVKTAQGGIDESQALIRQLEKGRPGAGQTAMDAYTPAKPVSGEATVAQTPRRMQRADIEIGEGTQPQFGGEGPPVTSQMREEIAVGASRPAGDVGTDPGMGQWRQPPEPRIVERKARIMQNMEKTHGEATMIADDVDSLMKSLEGSGILHDRQFKSVVKNARSTLDSVNTADASAMDKARIYNAMDHLKRAIGGQRVRRMKGRGANDHVAAAEYEQAYEQIRASLENPEVWGEMAAARQRDINVNGWMQFLETRPAYSQEFLRTGRKAYKRGARGWENRPSPKSSGALKKIMSEPGEHTDLEEIFEEGVTAPGELTDRLSSYYGGDPELMKKAGSIRGQGAALRENLEGARGIAAQQTDYRAVKEASPGSAKAIDRMTWLETAGDRIGQSKTAGRVRRVGSEIQRIAPILASVGASRASRAFEEAPAPHEQGYDTVTEMLRTAPEKLGEYAAPLAKAAEAGKRELQQKFYELAESSRGFRAKLMDAEIPPILASGTAVPTKPYSGTFAE